MTRPGIRSARASTLSVVLASWAPVADAGKLAAFEQLGSVGEVADQHQRRPPPPPDEQGERTSGVTRRREQGERAVAHEVERLAEGRQGRVVRGFEADPVPRQIRDHDVLAEEATGLGGEPQ